MDPETVRAVFREVATLLDGGLAPDGLDDHDARAVGTGLCADLVPADPGSAIRARSRATGRAPGDVHDPARVSAAYLVAAEVLQL